MKIMRRIPRFSCQYFALALTAALPALARDPGESPATNLKTASTDPIVMALIAVAVVTGITMFYCRPLYAQIRTGRPSTSLSVLRLYFLTALSAAPAYAAGDMVSNFLTSVVALITSTWAIAIVVIATFYVGYLFFFSDRRTHEHLSGWLFGCIFVLGCQVLAQQFIH